MRAGIRTGVVCMAAALAVGGMNASANAAAISYTGTPYQQNFDSFAGAAGAVSFANDSTLPGFYAYLSGGSSGGNTSVAGVPDIFYRNNGTTSNGTATATYSSGATIAHYFYRTTGAPNDVQLGLFDSDSNTTLSTGGYVSAGFAIKNDTGVTQTGFSLSYSLATSTTTLTNDDTLAVSYAINATGVADADGTYTAAAALSSTAAAANGAITGPTTNTISGLTIAPGDTLFIRFRDTNVGGTDRLFRLDNIVIAVPEPASLALIGLGGLGLLARRRKAR